VLIPLAIVHRIFAIKLHSATLLGRDVARQLRSYANATRHEHLRFYRAIKLRDKLAQ